MSWSKMQQGVCASLARNQYVWHMFCCHFKDNFRKMQRVFNHMFKHLGVENRKKSVENRKKRFAVLFPNFSKCASCCWYLCDLQYYAKTIFIISSYLHYNYVNSCFCLTASCWLYSTSWSAVRDSHMFYPLKYCNAMHCASTLITQKHS